MVVRAWLTAGGVLIAVAWIFTVAYAPQPFQGSASSTIDEYRARGLVPGPGRLTMSTAVGHEVFEIPETDAQHAAEAAAAMGDMPGMDMPGMDMPDMEQGGGDHAGEEPAHDEHSMASVEKDMKMEEGSEHTEGAGVESGLQHREAAQEPAHADQPMTSMKMEEGAGHGEGSEMASGIASIEGAHMGGHGGGGGLMMVAPDTPMTAGARTIRIDMSEWGFSPAKLDVELGESVRLVVRNIGNMPHEFMLMTHAGMSAINYRLERADWNLLEHEAIYERELVLPGDDVEVTFKIMRPGAWMYMCMFPYHMRFGMMGQMATEGMAMDMGSMM